MINLIIFFVIIWLAIATIQDLKRKEIDNLLNFSLLLFLLSYNLFYSIFNKNFNFFLQSLILLTISFIFANIFYYGHFFGGGDAKLLIAMSPSLLFSHILKNNILIFIFFILLLLIVGSVWTFLFSIYIITSRTEKFVKSFKKYKKILKSYLFIIPLSLILFYFIQETSRYLSLLLIIFPILIVYVKSVEECMIVKIETRKLREGDWLGENIKIGKKIVRYSFEGLSKKEIELLKKNKKFVKIKEGIPFTPSFLISFLILCYLWFYKQELFSILFFKF